MPGIVLAGRLTRHLVREIIVRGSGGGPLTPLADQFNHELTRLQVRRIGGMLAQLADQARDVLARPDSDVTVAGWPLEVHRPVQPEEAPPGAAGPAALCAARARQGDAQRGVLY